MAMSTVIALYFEYRAWGYQPNDAWACACTGNPVWAAAFEDEVNAHYSSNV